METKKFSNIHDCMLMDFENYALKSWNGNIPFGKTRVDNKKWIKHIKKSIKKEFEFNKNERKKFLNRYIIWVSNGGGDIYFEKQNWNQNNDENDGSVYEGFTDPE